VRPHIREASSFDVLDHRVRLPVLIRARLEHLRDARVVELGLHPRLVEEAGEEGAVVDMVAPDGLHDARSLRPLNPGGRGEVDVAHPAARDQLEEEEPPESARQRHGVA
jgi:hypothetical protein